MKTSQSSSCPLSLLPLLLLVVFLSPVTVKCRETFAAEFEILSYDRTINGSKDNASSSSCDPWIACIPSFKVCIQEYNAASEGNNISIDRKEAKAASTVTTRTPAAAVVTTASPRPGLPYNRFPSRMRTSAPAVRRKGAVRSSIPSSRQSSSSSQMSASIWDRIHGTVSFLSKFMGFSSMTDSTVGPDGYCSANDSVIRAGNQYPVVVKVKKIPKSLLTTSAPAAGEKSSMSIFESPFPVVSWRSSPASSQVTGKPILISIQSWHKDLMTTSAKLLSTHTEIRTPVLDSEWLTVVDNSSKGLLTYRWRIVPDSGDGDNEIDNAKPPVVTVIKPNCTDGFMGPECKEAICSPDCHPSRGYCNSPGECRCKFGWRGEDCSRCQKMPGCVHGLCVKPYECRCQEGWTGMFCDKPTCKLGCHPQNGFCEVPNECRCRFGFKGENCSDCATMPGCQRGSCSKPLDCQCDDGWRGLFCSMPICASGCDTEHGWCKRPGECRCRTGWTGSNCTQCVPYPGCQRGSCSQPWTCDCEPGWGGLTCDEKLDYCEQQASNPCLNGGSCVSVEAADQFFRCHCLTGFEGRKCEVAVMP